MVSYTDQQIQELILEDYMDCKIMFLAPIVKSRTTSAIKSIDLIVHLQYSEIIDRYLAIRTRIYKFIDFNLIVLSINDNFYTDILSL